VTTATLPGLSRGSAVFSPCGKYRYRLTRELGSGPRVVFAMLNPSTATETVSDPTVTRCMNFARSWGYGSLEVVNIFAYRSTDPYAMKLERDPVGPDNDRHIRDACNGAFVVCAWGRHGSFLSRDLHVIWMLRQDGVRLHCLKMTKDHLPSHPLYLPGSLKPVPYAGRPA
jgi:hypothetical protein